MTARRIYGIWDARTAPKSSRYCFARQQCCVCRVGRLKPFHRIAVISTAKRWMKRKSARNANYRCYRTSRVIFFFFFFIIMHLMWKNTETTWMRREEIITRSKRRHIFASIALFCLPEHFKQCITISKLVKCDSLSTHEKQDENCVCRAIFHYIFARSAASWEREGRHKSAYLCSELVPSLP